MAMWLDGRRVEPRLVLTALGLLVASITPSCANHSPQDSERASSPLVSPEPAPHRPPNPHRGAVSESPAPTRPAPPPPVSYQPGSTTFVVLPDTQVYARLYPSIFLGQTQWIAQQRDARDIRFVMQVGDVTEYNDRAQWEVARSAFALLDGVVPYAMATGNHDYGYGGASNTRASLLSAYFPPQGFAGRPGFGGTFEPGGLENSYHLFSAAGSDWVVVSLEWAPRDGALTWADGVLRRHADRIGILVTHAYLHHDDSRQEYARSNQDWNPHDYQIADEPGGVNDGEEIWNKLVRRHGNMAFVFSGHVLGDGVGRLSSIGDSGNTVHQLLANYQMREQGGQGFLRLLEIRPDGRSVQVKTYSPLLDKYRTSSDEQFEVEIDVVLKPRPDASPGAAPPRGEGPAADARPAGVRRVSTPV